MRALQRVRTRHGRCYELAGNAFISDDPEAVGATLVHGAVRALKLGQRMGHSWLLLADGRVYDPVLNRYFAWPEYEARYYASAERQYTRLELGDVVLANGHWGPWHAVGGSPTCSVATHPQRVQRHLSSDRDAT